MKKMKKGGQGKRSRSRSKRRCERRVFLYPSGLIDIRQQAKVSQSVSTLLRQLICPHYDWIRRTHASSGRDNGRWWIEMGDSFIEVKDTGRGRQRANNRVNGRWMQFFWRRRCCRLANSNEKKRKHKLIVIESHSLQCSYPSSCQSIPHLSHLILSCPVLSCPDMCFCMQSPRSRSRQSASYDSTPCSICNEMRWEVKDFITVALIESFFSIVQLNWSASIL